MSEFKKTLADHGHQLIRIREEINVLRGDDLRLEIMQAQMDHRLARIEQRLQLAEA